MCLEKKIVCVCVYKNEHKCGKIQTKLNVGQGLEVWERTK